VNVPHKKQNTINTYKPISREKTTMLNKWDQCKKTTHNKCEQRTLQPVSLKLLRTFTARV